VFHSASLTGQMGEAGGVPRPHLDRSFRSTRYLAADTGELAAATAAISRAARPVIVAGSGIRLSRAYDQLRDFAARADIPVATTAAGKGVFPEDHELALGVMGTFGHASANAGVGDADLVIAIGTKLGATDTAQEHPKLIDGDRQVRRAAQRRMDAAGVARDHRRRRRGVVDVDEIRLATVR
jgi:acetolactate synthase-1/2/3 large subunit